MAEALNAVSVTAATVRNNAGANLPVTFATTTLAVDDMHCGSCMRSIEQTLSALPGVVAARTNLTTRRVTVLTATRPPSAEPFIMALRANGFTATALSDQDARPQAHVDHDYLKRLGVAGFAAANIMLLSVAVWSGFGSDMPASLHTLFHWLSALIALPAIAYAGQPFFRSARSALAARRLNMDVPISLGVLLATAMSLFQTWRGSGQVYFDAATMLLFFLLIGRALDERMRARAVSAAENLLGLRTAAASVINGDGSVERIATDAIKPGMRVLIAAGERVPVDARITRGSGDIDESLITGETRPRTATVGEQLHSGTVALSGPLEAEATAVAENTLLAEIARLMQTAEQARGRYVRLADRAARLYAPAVHILGLVTFTGWLLAGYGWEPALTAAIAVLIITCPCALALAVPAVQVVATGRLFRRGVVLKAADGLERLAEVNTIVFDKTGTLTLGEPQLTNAAGIPDAIMAGAASLAAQSRHPYAKAVARAGRDRGLVLPVLPSVEEIAGGGLKATVEAREVRLGSADFCGVVGGRAGEQTLWFCDGTNAPVAFPVSDALRVDAKEVVDRLAAAGYGLEILSGDRLAAVADMARAVGIVCWRAGQHPDQKIARIHELAGEGCKVLMIGDGMNDAPALAAGHAAISPSSAADISQNAADAVFQGDKLGPILEILAVAKAARRRSLENFAIAIGYNVLFVPLAMAGLVTPLIAAIAMSASSIAVTANALRLSQQDLEP
jgi:P-type Cu2+ transporter